MHCQYLWRNLSYLCQSVWFQTCCHFLSLWLSQELSICFCLYVSISLLSLFASLSLSVANSSFFYLSFSLFLFPTFSLSLFFISFFYVSFCFSVSRSLPHITSLCSSWHPGSSAHVWLNYVFVNDVWKEAQYQLSGLPPPTHTHSYTPLCVSRDQLYLSAVIRAPFSHFHRAFFQEIRLISFSPSSPHSSVLETEAALYESVVVRQQPQWLWSAGGTSDLRQCLQLSDHGLFLLQWLETCCGRWSSHYLSLLLK